MTSRPPFLIPFVVPRELSPRFIAALAALAVCVGRIALDGSVRLAAGHLAVPPVAVDRMSIIGLVAVFVVLVPVVQTVLTAAVLEGFGRLTVDARVASLFTAFAWGAGQGWIGGEAQVAGTLWTFWIVCGAYLHVRQSRPAVAAAIHAASVLTAGNAAALVLILRA
jgi:hypothetical protein